MFTPKEFGKTAKASGINAPTLDEKFSLWLSKTEADKKRDYLVQWWEGWYEALDESLSMPTILLRSASGHNYQPQM